MNFPVTFILALTVVVVECSFNLNATGLGTTSRSAYLLDYDAVESVTSQIKESDQSFYRMDKIFGARSKNDGAWHNYKTISTFSSTCNKGMTEFFQNLGFEASTNAYGYNGSTMVTNCLFSVKYLISNTHLKTDNLLSYVLGDDGEFIYKNISLSGSSKRTYTLGILKIIAHKWAKKRLVLSFPVTMTTSSTESI